MPGLQINLIDGTPGGPIELYSVASMVRAYRFAREQVGRIESKLRRYGVYMLFLPGADVYVGETGLDTLRHRIFARHRNATSSIDSAWTHALAFTLSAENVSKNEFLYLENALCGYAYGNRELHCINAQPPRERCTPEHRRTDYGLSDFQREQCEAWFADIERCLSALDLPRIPGSRPPEPPPPPPPGGRAFHYAGARALIYNDGDPRADRRTIVLAGSRISPRVRESGWSNPNARLNALAARAELVAAGRLVGGTLRCDQSFDSPTRAWEFVSGRPGSSWVADDTGEVLTKRGRATAPAESEE